jgi:hypothetical protein
MGSRQQAAGSGQRTVAALEASAAAAALAVGQRGWRSGSTSLGSLGSGDRGVVSYYEYSDNLTRSCSNLAILNHRQL